jgi:hypothetical protein
VILPTRARLPRSGACLSKSSLVCEFAQSEQPRTLNR